jgi:hypothetical protein
LIESNFAAPRHKRSLGFDLSCCYFELNANGLGRKKEKRNILILEANRKIQVEFRKDKLKKDDDFFKRILWTDETTTKAYPNVVFVFYRASSTRIDIVSPRV